jgi:hypothetical protein
VLQGGFNNYVNPYHFSQSFGENLANPAQAAFANFVAQQHDHKAAQLGSFEYSNGSVWFYSLLLVDLRSYG